MNRRPYLKLFKLEDSMQHIRKHVLCPTTFWRDILPRIFGEVVCLVTGCQVRMHSVSVIFVCILYSDLLSCNRISFPLVCSRPFRVRVEDLIRLKSGSQPLLRCSQSRNRLSRRVPFMGSFSQPQDDCRARDVGRHAQGQAYVDEYALVL
jgi:hypothetical protein